MLEAEGGVGDVRPLRKKFRVKSSGAVPKGKSLPQN